MKRLFLLSMLPLLAITFNSCSKEDEGSGKTKLVKSIVSKYSDSDDARTVIYKYDSQQRITKIERTDSDDGITSSNTITYGNNTITDTDGYTFTLNNGYLIKEQWENEYELSFEYTNGYVSKDDGDAIFTWENGNLVKIVRQDSDGDYTSTFTYNNIENKSNIDFYGYITSFGEDTGMKFKGMFSKNYLVSASYGDSSTTYSYRFDEDGYPTEIVETYSDYDNLTRTKYITYY